MIAIWIIYALQRMGVLDEGSLKQQRKFHLLEFGPGLGTLQCEIVKVLEQFELLNDLQITFIEQSDFMRQK
jgi:SAM-dependent MidA family methyltransferase